ncbi:MAG: chorismate-binding protein, partial [Lachnospiraceae bacterium]|nr:chorismate-binding protein [Lachnospiraceae bacterium]
MKRIGRAYSKTVSIINETAVQIYDSFVGKKEGFLLESYDKNNGRYVFMGKEPEEKITSTKTGIEIVRKDKTVIRYEGNPIDLLKIYYSDFEIRKDDGELAFTGGLVGALGYDFVRYKEKLPDENPDEIGVDTIQLMLVTEFITIDHLAETMTAVVIEEDNQSGRKRGEERCRQLIEEAFSNIKPMVKRGSHDGIIVKKSDSLSQYCDKVNKIKEYIREGHIFQTVLSQRWTIETKQDGFELYKELRDLNPSPYLYYFNYGSFEIIGSSPEMIVQYKNDKVTTCPIAGTRPRGKTEEEDKRLQDELLNDPKEIAEHVMLVDLARNDMGRISEFGTVKVTDFKKVQNYSHVMHMVSFVEGRKKGEYHPFDLVNAFLPAGTLSGAPKIRAMEIIDELEDVRR